MILNGQPVFQPIVTMAGHAVHHYEVLTRLPDGRSPYEAVAFSEEIGLIETFDLRVCRRAIRELESHSGHRLAVNVSGRSIQSDKFRNALQELILPRKELAPRLIFELTESSVVTEIEGVAAFLAWLREQGHMICLDDFGAGAATYSYLRYFEVDFVKIDGPFLKAAVTGRRERALIGSICRLCKELGSATIGEMIETEKEAEAAAALGIDYGQGWLYGKPTDTLPALRNAISPD